MTRVVLALLIRPWLWPSVLRFVPDRWWTYSPYLPIPPKEYLHFRLETMYGDTTSRPTQREVVSYLNWCRQMQALGSERMSEPPTVATTAFSPRPVDPAVGPAGTTTATSSSTTTRLNTGGA